MEYSLDKPIGDENQDLLNRSAFAKHFAKDIVMLSNKNNFTIALNGQWGSGKTSLINLVKNEIVRLRDFDENVISYPVIIDFAPWNSLDENGIINQFFHAITSNFKKNKIKSFLSNSKTKLALKLLKELPQIGTFFKCLSSFFDKYLKDCLEDNKELMSVKEDIIKTLNRIDYNFIVFIDDIDRLNNKEIRLLIQLVKAICDFPNVTYILSYDKDIVANALSYEQTSDGYKYLEKIIQLSIDVPEANSQDFQNYLFNRLDMILNMSSDSKFDTERWSYVFRNGFYKYFNNIRDINRYTNVARFKYQSYRVVLNPLGFLVMEAISLFEPKLLDFIKFNKDILCKSINNYDTSQQRKEIEELEKQCQIISNNFNIIKLLFPYANNSSWSFGGYSDNLHYNQYKSNGRICYDKNFDFYFSGKLDNESISKEEVKRIIINEDEAVFKTYFDSLNNNTFTLFLQFLYGYIEDELYFNEILNLLPKIINVSHKFKDKTGFFVFGNATWIEGLMDKIFENKGSDFSFKWLECLYNESCNYEFLINNLYHIAHTTKIYYDNKDEKPSFFNEEQILKLHNLLVKRLECYIKTEDYINSNNLINIIRFLNIRNKAITKKWIKKQQAKDSLLIKIIGKSIYKGYGESSKRFITYNFPLAQFIDLINIDKLKDDLMYFVKTNDFDKLDEENKLGIILFIMPERTADNAYVSEEINKFCNDNNINYNCVDEFVD